MHLLSQKSKTNCLKYARKKKLPYARGLVEGGSGNIVFVVMRKIYRTHTVLQN